MTTTNFKLQSIACYIITRSTRNAGISSINLAIAIDGAHDRVPLGILWPTDKFDKRIGKLLPRFAGDKECFDHNLIIDKNLAVANQLRLQIYAFPDKKIDTKEFKQRFRNFDSRDNFIPYMENKIKQLYECNLIKKRTMSNNMAVLNKLKDYPPSKGWDFNVVRASDLQLYFNWCLKAGKIEKNLNGEQKRKPLSYNTTIGHFKTISKYFSAARQDKIPFENPFDNFKFGDYKAGIREVIDATELRQLYDFRKNEALTEEQRRVLDKFLLACFTGLRKSDIEQLVPKRIIVSGVIYLKPLKTAAHGTEVKFNLPVQAIEILKTYVKSGVGSDESSYLNKVIKVVASKAGINKYLKFHSSRDCFAVLYLKLGGNLADLKDILGHKRISTTEIYLKMGSDAKNDTMAMFSKVI